MTLAAGSRLGHFEIVELIGAGGMGEVYRARDPRLGRDVAVKVLPAAVSADADRVRRFEQEARAAGVLNHPNLTAVHDIGTHDGALYVVSELLEGETLRSRLAGGALPLRKALDYARQIALGLAAAHEKGIVHRDLKPENIFVTKDGRVKILDFGLAKLTRPEEGSGSLTNLPTASAGTEPGVVLGTLGYMSPEQVRGKPADHRSDIFSFGAILYEMLSGKRAFHGDSAADTMSAILREDPPELSATNRNVPPGLERIVRHCLEKSPEERFHAAHDLAFDLGAISEISATPTLVAPRRKPRSVMNAALTAVALLLTAAVIFLMARVAGQKPPEPPRTSFLTFSGYDRDPAASPDGKLIAFVSQRDGRSRIWLKQLATGDEVALTSGEDTAPRFSRDGSELLFVRAEGAVSSLFRVSLVGGEPRKMIERALAGDWSPDGSRIAFVRQSEQNQRGGSVLAVAAADGSGERHLAQTADQPLLYPRWSPDGRTVAAVRLGSIVSAPDQIALIDAETGTSRLLPASPGAGVISSFAWTRSGKQVVYAQASQPTSQVPLSRVVVQDVESGDRRTLLWLPNLVGGLDLLAPGEVVFDAISLRQNLREIALDRETRVAEEWTTRGNSADRQPIYSPDGNWIAFSSTRSGNIDIWQVHRETGAVRRLTSDPADDWDPGFTRDGKTLIFSSNRGGNFEIWLADADGRRARQLTKDGVDAENATATPDGAWIVYASGNPAKRGLWKIRRDGSDAVRLLSFPALHPEVSPDGKYVLYHTLPDPGWVELRVVRIDDGAPVDFRIRIEFPGGQVPVDLTTGPASLGRARWMPHGRAVAYVTVDENGLSGIVIQDFVPGRDTSSTRRPLAGFGQGSAESLGISPDGTRLVVSGIEASPVLMSARGIADLDPARTTERRER